ncbi:MAG: hypothetical protein M0T77_06650 [Actinomycetota bacterium]|nr:hypothetical protein [Actinomycetota bacterium]
MSELRGIVNDAHRPQIPHPIHHPAIIAPTQTTEDHQTTMPRP